jgi:hypothetical protein
MSRLHDAPILWFATVRSDGRPHLTPIWFVAVDDVLWLCTEAQAVKARNVAAHPAVSVAIGDGSLPTLAGEGTATVHARPFPDAVVRAFVDKFDWDISATDEGYDALIEIRIKRWLMGSP